jgi:hypothetical protein
VGVKSRLSLDLAVPVRAKVEQAAAELGFKSLAECVRRSLDVYGRLIQAHLDGKRVVVERDGAPPRELILPDFAALTRDKRA